MEKNRTSESIAVLSEVSEPLTSETDKASALTGEHEAHVDAVTANAPSVSGITVVEESHSPSVDSIIGVTNSSNGTMVEVHKTSPVGSSTSRRRESREVSDEEAPSYKNESDNSVDENTDYKIGNEALFDIPDDHVWPEFFLSYELEGYQPNPQDSQNDIVLKKLEIMTNKMIDVAIEIQETLNEANELTDSIMKSKE